jgi:hypothetical protein
MLCGYQTDWATAFLSPMNSASDASGARLAGVQTGGISNDHFVQDPHCGCRARGHAGPGKMTAMKMTNDAMGPDAMMKNATKVQDNTVFFMQGNQLYMAYGILDSAGNFYRQ